MRLAVLASGSGTILDAMLQRGLPIHLVVVDRRCGAEHIAAGGAVPCILVERTDFSDAFDRDAHTEAVVAALAEHQIDLVAMAGYGTILGPAIFEAFRGKVINTHPALLPAFKGWHAVRDALAAQVDVTGCTVHVATQAVDDGPILAQRSVPVLEGDTEAQLHERIKAVERVLYPDVLEHILERGAVVPLAIGEPQ